MTTATAVPELVLPSFFGDLESADEIGDPGSTLIYGTPGKWKTSKAAGIAAVRGMNRVLYIDYDNGSEVLGNLDFPNIKILKINTLAPGAYEKSAAVIAELLSPAGAFWDAVVVDTLDVWQDMAEKYQKIVLAAEAAATGKVPHGAAIWSKIGLDTDEFVRSLHNTSNFTTVFVSHSQENKEPKFSITPKLGGSSKDQIAGIPSVVAFMEFTDVDGTDAHITHLGESSFLVTKNRYNLPKSVIDFSFEWMYGEIWRKRAEKAAAKAPTPTPAAVAA